MAVDVVSDRLGELYPSGYVPISSVLSGPGPASSWSDPCPRLHVARYAHPLPDDAPCPEGGGMSLLATRPLSWTDLLQRIPTPGDGTWTDADSGRAGAAYGMQQQLVDAGLADHLVVLTEPAAKERRVLAVEAMSRYRSCSTVAVTDGRSEAVTIGLRTRSAYEALERTVMSVTAVAGRHPAAVRALYGPALQAWHTWWRRAGKGKAAGSTSAPWPRTLEFTEPDSDQVHRVRVDAVSEVALAAVAQRR
jgi:hypothetical protein